MCVVDFGNAELIPEWFTAGIQDRKCRNQIEQYQYNRILPVSQAPDGAMHRDDILGLARLLGVLLNITVPSHEHIHFETWVEISGRRNFNSYIRKYELTISRNYTAREGREIKKLPSRGLDWKALVNDCNKGILDETAYDLLKGLLQFSYIDRRMFFLSSFNHEFFQLV